MFSKIRPILVVLVFLAIGVGLLLGGTALSSCSFHRLQQMRELERVPQTAIGAVLPGEVNLVGRIHLQHENHQNGLRSERTNTRCVYYRYHVERRETDSEGKSRWVTVSDVTRFEPFLLADDTGAIRVIPHAEVHYTVPQSHRDRVGDMRYTEYRLDPGHEVFCFGCCEHTGDAYHVAFTVEGRYTPIISRGGEHGERVGMATDSVFACWGGLSLLSLAILFACLVFRVHRIIVYLTFVALLLGGGLVYFGVSMMEDDLLAAHDRLTRHRTHAEREWRDTLQAHNITWDGEWVSLGSLDEARYAQIAPATRQRLQRIRVDLWRATERANEILARFPERWLAPALGLEPAPTLNLPPVDREWAAELDRSHEPARLPESYAWIAGVPALLLGILLTRFGFRRIKHKRYTENMPTSPTTGVAWGPAELVGTVTLAEPDALKGPLSAEACVQFHYVVSEKRGSGKNSKWVTIEDRREHQPFYCLDDHGRLLVVPEGAEIITRHTTTRSSGNRRYRETRLEVGDKLYALGYVKAHPPNFDMLEMRKNDDRLLGDFPYLLSNYSESQIMQRLARIGFTHLNIALCALVLLALVWFGASGSFAATDYLAAALIAPAYLALLFGMLMYNDLAFLRNRVGAARGNIEVALKKRHDLLPNLEAVVKQYMAHESGMLQRIAALRAAAANGVIEQPSLHEVAVIAEKYPALKTDGAAGALMQSLTQVENEIALMRQGYNQAVERYNSRIQHIPEVLLAKLFRFRPADLFQADYVVHQVPRVEVER